MADANFDKRVLLLHMDGSDNGTAFTDSSRSARSVTRYNAVTKTGTKKYGTASGYFDGSGDYLSIADHADWAFGSGDWTIEAWVNLTSLAGQSVIAAQRVDATDANNMWYFRINATSGTVQFYDKSSSSEVTNVASSAGLSTEQWYHVAAVRSSGHVKLYIDGNDDTSVTTDLTGAYSDKIVPLSIGGYAAGAQSFYGYLDDVRITKGYAEYTANFTPPAAAFQEYQKAIFGTLTEDSAITDWLIRTHRVDTGALLSEIVATSSPYECPCGVSPNEYTGLVTVSCLPKIDGKWTANTAYSSGAYITPTNPVTTPYVFKCTTAGTSHSTTEPTWDTTPGNTTSDNSAVWTCQDRLVQPILHGPLLPQLPS